MINNRTKIGKRIIISAVIALSFIQNAFGQDILFDQVMGFKYFRVENKTDEYTGVRMVRNGEIISTTAYLRSNVGARSLFNFNDI